MDQPEVGLPLKKKLFQVRERIEPSGEDHTRYHWADDKTDYRETDYYPHTSGERSHDDHDEWMKSESKKYVMVMPVGSSRLTGSLPSRDWHLFDEAVRERKKHGKTTFESANARKTDRKQKKVESKKGKKVKERKQGVGKKGK